MPKLENQSEGEFHDTKPDFLIKIANLFDKVKLFFYILRKGRHLDRPFYAHYQITRRCNFRCGSCDTWRDKKATRGMPLEDMREAAMAFRKIGVKCVALTGGEPLLRTDIVDIVRIFKSAGLIVRLQTNGYLLSNSLIKKLFRAGVADIYISLDSLDQETFNEINGLDRADAFKKVLSVIKQVAQTAKRFGSGVHLTAVLRKSNLDEIDALHDFAIKQGVLIGIYGMEIPPSDSQLNIRSSDASMAHSDEDRKILAEVFGRLSTLSGNGLAALSTSEKLMDDYRSYFASPQADMHWDCNAGRYYFEMLPDGTIGVCNATSPIEGLTFRNLEDFYSNPERESIFREKRQSCDGCICTRQLEYLVDDRLDLFNKARIFMGALFNRTP